MTKAELAMLERAFAQEIESARHAHGIAMIQSKAKVVGKLVADGILHYVERRIGGYPPVTVKGYELTELGRMTYCMSCADYEAEE